MFSFLNFLFSQIFGIKNPVSADPNLYNALLQGSQDNGKKVKKIKNNKKSGYRSLSNWIFEKVFINDHAHF